VRASNTTRDLSSSRPLVQTPESRFDYLIRINDLSPDGDYIPLLLLYNQYAYAWILKIYIL
jgi:hypothetical protein